MPTATPTSPPIWPTPTRVPFLPEPLDFSQIYPTLVENYAQSAEYSVQSWNTFTDPVRGVDTLLIFFTVAIIAFGIWRLHKKLRELNGQ